MTAATLLVGFLALFLLYQIAEANGQGLVNVPGKPFSILLLYLLVIPAADLVARWQHAPGLQAYGLALHPGWWQNYLLGLGSGIIVQAAMEFLGVWLGIRQVLHVHVSWGALLAGIVWVLLTNFPAAAAEDLVTRGYPWRFMKSSPLLIFMVFSAFLYTLNHIIRLLTRPVTDWYHLPFLGLTLAYALFQTGSLWYVIGLHQAGNVIYSLMRQMMDITNTEHIKRRLAFGIVTELVMLLVVVAITPFAVINR